MNRKAIPSLPVWCRRWMAYLFAMAATSATVSLRLVFGYSAGDPPMLLLLLIPIMLIAYMGGVGPGLAAIALAGVEADYYLLPPLHSFALRGAYIADFLVLIGVGAFSAVLVTSLKANQRHLKDALTDTGEFRAAVDKYTSVVIVDPQAKIRFVNDKTCAMSKYSREELLGQDFRFLYSGHHSETFMRDLLTTISSGEVWHGEIKNKARDGTFYWVDTTIVPFLNEQGKPWQYVAFRADITERKRAAEAQSWLAAIVNSSKDAIISKTLDGIITSWNPGATKMFGYTSDEVIGQSTTILFPPELVMEEVEILARVARGENVKHFDTVRVRKDGTEINVSVMISPVVDNEGKIIGASKIARSNKFVPRMR